MSDFSSYLSEYTVVNYQTQKLTENLNLESRGQQEPNCWDKFFSLLALLAIFIVYEGFSILPDSLVVPFPGQFRLADTSFIILFVSFSIFLPLIVRVVQRHRRISLLLFASAGMLFLAALMAKISFDQPFIIGILYIRHSFNYFLFFPFMILLSTEIRIKFFIKSGIIFVSMLAFGALMQKIDPSLPIFNYIGGEEEKYSNPDMMRFGDFRLFFPNIEFALLFFFIVLSDLVNNIKVRYFGFKAFFLCLISYVVVLTGTRSHLVAIIIVSVVVIMMGPKRWLKLYSIILFSFCIFLQIASYAVSQQGFSVFTENRVSKTLVYSVDKTDGSIQGRLEQCKMYWDNFLKSPIAGVGSLRYSQNKDYYYQKYNFFSNNDIGYLKILAEYGIVGFLWVLYFFYCIVNKHINTKFTSSRYYKENFSNILSKGVMYFISYVAVSMVTIPHLIEGKRIITIMLSIVFLESIKSSKIKNL